VGATLKTPEQVVETAIQGIRSNKRVAISGFKNAMLARLGQMVPNSVIVKALAKQFRPAFGDK